jgi:POT family proton-dependent oligopeptide transporter
LLRRVSAGVLAVVLVTVLLTFAGVMSFSAEGVSNAFGFVLLGIVVIFFLWLLTAKGYTPLERRRFWAILVLFLGSSLFWSAFEQAGSTLSLFAERNTDLHTWDAPVWGLFRASYFQSFNSVFIILLAPVFAWLWVALSRREPSMTAKFSWGLIFVGLSFAILVPVSHGQNVSPWWLTFSYFLATVGELCLSPVGLSGMTKLAPARIASLMMGVWFLSTSVGDFIGGRLASVYETFPLPMLFGIVAGFCMVVGALLFLLIRPMKRLSGGVN